MAPLDEAPELDAPDVEATELDSPDEDAPAVASPSASDSPSNELHPRSQEIPITARTRIGGRYQYLDCVAATVERSRGAHG